MDFLDKWENNFNSNAALERDRDKMLLAEYVKIFQMAKSNLKNNNFIEAVNLFRDCLSLAEVLNDEVKIVESAHMLSSGLFSIGAYAELPDYLIRCMNLIHSISTSSGSCGCFLNDEENVIPFLQVKMKVLSKQFKTYMILNNLDKSKASVIDIIENLKSENLALDVKLIMLKKFIKTIFTKEMVKISGGKKLRESLPKFYDELENMRTDIRFNNKTTINPELKGLLLSLLSANLPLLIKFMNEKFYSYKYAHVKGNYSNTTANTVHKLINILNKNNESFKSKSLDKIKLTVESMMRVNKIIIDFKSIDFSLDKFIAEWKRRNEIIEEIREKILNIYDLAFKAYEGELSARGNKKKQTHQVKGGKLILDPLIPSDKTYKLNQISGSINSSNKPNSPIKSNSSTKVNFFKKNPLASEKTINSTRPKETVINLNEDNDNIEHDFLSIKMNPNINSLYSRKERRIRKGSMNELSMENFFKSINTTKSKAENNINNLYNKGKKSFISNLQKTKTTFINLNANVNKKEDNSSSTTVNTGSTQNLTPSPRNNNDVFVEYKHLKIDKKALEKIGKISSKTPILQTNDKEISENQHLQSINSGPTAFSLNPSPIWNKKGLNQTGEVINLFSTEEDNSQLIQKLIDHLKKNLNNDWYFDNKQQNPVVDYSYKTKNGKYYSNIEKINQDSYFIFEHYMMIKNFYFFGVCDGHGSNGHHASEHAKHYIPANLLFLEIEKSLSPLNKHKLSSLNKDLEQILAGKESNTHFLFPPQQSINILKFIYEKLRIGAHCFSFCKKLSKNIHANISEAFNKTHEDIKNRNFESDLSGTTVCSVFILGKNLYCANLGDSRAVMATLKNDTLIPVALSKDHKPDNEEEKKRILNCNGRVEQYKNDFDQPVGPKRVWQQNVDSPGLAMSRSIGDCVASKIGVISEPEILEFTLKSNDKFIIIASDGIWEFISNEKAVEIVAPYYFKKNPSDACNELLNTATKLWMTNEKSIDDITCIVIFLDVKS